LRQLISKRAPPNVLSLTTRWACVDVMMASAMASPRPVPPASEVVRWNRSKTMSRSSTGIPGPLSSTVSSRPVRDGLHAHLDAAPRSGELTRVVDEDSDQPVDRLGVGADGRRHRRTIKLERHAVALSEALETVRRRRHSRRRGHTSRLHSVLDALRPIARATTGLPR
jgi:hypothetical protein